MYKLILFLGLNVCLCAGLIAQPEISPGDLNKKMARGDDYVLLDVRTPEEVMDGYINGAVHIDIKAEDFESRISKLDKSKTYYVYCASGARSAKASQIMLDMGFNDVYSVKGGIRAWKEEKLPVTKRQ